jgi:hypothetical protein
MKKAYRDMYLLSVSLKKLLNAPYMIIILALYFVIFAVGTTRSQDQQVAKPAPKGSTEATTGSTSETDILEKTDLPCGSTEGKTKNRSQFPQHPELYQPMPIPDPTKRPPKRSGINPEVPVSQGNETGVKPISDTSERPPKPSGDNPEVPVSHTTGNETGAKPISDTSERPPKPSGDNPGVSKSHSGK